jgi:hypothetical protein
MKNKHQGNSQTNWIQNVESDTHVLGSYELMASPEQILVFIAGARDPYIARSMLLSLITI